MNWSTMTKWSGGYSSRSDPTAESEITSVTPLRFSASIFARKFSAEGGLGWPRPGRGRKTQRIPASVPKSSLSEASLQGVATWRHSRSSSE